MKNTYNIVASLAGAGLLIAAMMVVGGSFWSFRQIKEAADARKNTFVVMQNANELLSALKDAETGQRGYLLTGDGAFLEPYSVVRDSIGGRLEELRKLTLSGAAHKHLDALAPLVAAKLAEMENAIKLRRNNHMSAALAVVGGGSG